MEIFKSSVLGFIFSKSSLKLTKDGLYRKIKTKHGTFSEFITDDPVKVLKLIDLNYDIASQITNMEDFFSYLITSDYVSVTWFRVKKNGNVRKHNRTIQAFAKYILANKSNQVDERIRSSRILEITGVDVKSIIEEVHEIVKTFHEKKFDGNMMLELLGVDYDRKQFGKHLHKMKKHFGRTLDYERFRIHHSSEEWLEKFKEVNNLKLSYEYGTEAI